MGGISRVFVRDGESWGNFGNRLRSFFFEVAVTRPLGRMPKAPDFIHGRGAVLRGDSWRLPRVPYGTTSVGFCRGVRTSGWFGRRIALGPIRGRGSRIGGRSR